MQKAAPRAASTGGEAVEEARGARARLIMASSGFILLLMISIWLTNICCTL